MPKPPVAEQVQVNFRMPASLRDRIKTAAENNGRSMNAELIEALEEKYPAPFSDAESREMIAAYSLMFSPDRSKMAGMTDEEIARNERLLLSVLKYRLNEPEPRRALDDIRASMDPAPAVTINRMIEWLDEMNRFFVSKGIELTNDAAGKVD